MNITAALTVEAWIKVNTIDGNYHDIVSRIDRNTPGSGGGYALTVTNVGQIRMDLFQAHNQWTTVIGATGLTAGTWYHVAGVFSGTQLRVYVNGVLDGSFNTTNAPVSSNSLLRIGRAAHAPGPPLYLPSYAFAGLIDEVRVSAAALYTSNFTAGLGAGSNVRGLWKFDGQTANDFSGTGNHSTLVGGATYSVDVPPATNNAPTVSLVHPLNISAFAAGSNIVMDATATDSDGSVSKVDFYQGTTLLGTDTAAPYSFVWTNVPVGSYSLTAQATDDGNASTTSSAIDVSVLAAGGQHSLSLNGTTASADVPNHPSLNITGALTVEAWIKVNTIDGNYHDIVSRIDRNTPGSGGGYALSVTNVGSVRLDLFQAHNQWTTAVGTTALTAGTWYHVAGVFSGTQMRVYVNGVLDGSFNTTNAPVSSNSLLRIGRAAHASGPPLYLPSYAFAGLIDEVRVSAAALYTSNFTAGLGAGSNVRGLWKFDGQTVNDLSGAGNHCTLMGGATYSTDVPPAGGPQRPVPTAGGPYSGQLAQSVQFSSSGSFDPDGSIASYHWNFGDGTSANTANPAHTYATPGLYTATLTVTDNAGLLASATAPVTISNNGVARLDPMNQTGGSGENPLSRNFNWSLPLVSLPGRAGLDLGISLSYNSLVWTRSGNYITFDDDRGFPGPGFRLGFPVIQPLYYNSEVGKYAFLLISPDGSRTELRQVGSSALFEAADSSYLLLDSNTMVLRATDGTQLTYVLLGNEFNCTQIKDSNGNYLTINYTSFGRIDTVIDTLARSIKFNYDTNGWLTSITQVWNQGSPSQVTHNWARFTYVDTTIQTNFTGLTIYGPSNGSMIKNLSKVTLADGSHSDFSYTSWGQVWKVSSFAPDNHLLNHRSYNLPQTADTAQTDCPRFTERHDWAQYWNGDTDGTAATNEEAVTGFIAPVTETWTMPDGTSQNGTRAQVTSPDGTVNKIYFIGTAGTSSGWRRGLPALVETINAGTWHRKVMTTWTQDNTSVSYRLNPRVTETNVYDPAGNRARTETTYQQFNFANGTSAHLPIDFYEYAADATTKLRSTRTDYNTSTTYTNRRIIGLVSEVRVYEGAVTGPLVSKVASIYDESGSIQGADAPVQHDNTNYTVSFLVGRANLSSMKRFDVNNTSLFITMKRKYNTAGAIVSVKDGLDHEVTISYADSFSDGNNSRNTLANATTMTDPDGYTTTSKYNFDFGAMTYKRTPQPDVVTNTPGPEQSFTFDALGRLQQITNLGNNSYVRFEYPSHTRIDTYATIQEGAGEAHSFKITDGVGRVVATAQDHPGSTGGFSGRKITYDVMGRQFEASNPTETTASGAPSQWNTVGDDAAAGWIYVQQTYDWKGRPLVTTNQDGTTGIASYSGCGCAGGVVTTLTDEGSIDASGVTMKRQRKTYADVLGRIVKSETLNWQAGTVYAAAVSTYNARNQPMQMTHYAGPAGSSTHQDTTFTYDGHGRLKSKHAPEQDENKFTTWTYNADDSINVITDPRGATSTFAYNNHRKLVNTATYELAGKPTITVSYTYDSVGNIKSITDPSGSTSYSYNSVGKIASETRQLTGISGQSFTMGYAYNLGGQLKTFTLPTQFGTTVSYEFDRAGRLIGVTNTGYTYTEQFGEVPLPTFLSNVSYRAWNDVKSMDDGDGASIQYAYNSRLAPSSYTIPNLYGGGSMSWNYTYHPDGNIKFAADTAENDFDRKYEYDQVGRLVEAYSGREARGEAPSFPTPDSPYRQTNVYNEFGNRLQQTGRIWQKNLSGNPFSYSNNRRVGLEYDEAGRVVEDLQGIHVFDAQGQRSLVTAGTVGGGATGNPEMPAAESATVNDGRGLPAAVTATSRGEELVGQGPQTTISTSSETAFYLRSTVLDAVIAELNAAGQRSKEYVYAGGERLVAWTITPWNTSLEWQHKNPITGAWISIFAPSNSALRTEVDPSGRATGNEPFLIPPEPEEPKQTRETFYPIEGAPSINEELGMQLYEDRYINKVFGDQAGPGEGPYVGDNWSRWAEEREFQLMTGQRFLSGIDELNANIPGSLEWEEEYETLDGGESWSQGEDGNWVASTTVISRSLGFRLVPGSGNPQRPSDPGQQNSVALPPQDSGTSFHCLVSAMLDVIAYAEGNPGYDEVVRGRVISSSLYPSLVGQRNVKITNFSQHPEILVQVNNRGLKSTAAGRYQFKESTWKALGLPDFTAASQDLAALFKMRQRNMIQPLIQGNFAQAVANGNAEWASFPGAPYGQPTKKLAELQAVYNTSLKKC